MAFAVTTLLATGGYTLMTFGSAYGREVTARASTH
jgi:hypothetical protein